MWAVHVRLHSHTFWQICYVRHGAPSWQLQVRPQPNKVSEAANCSTDLLWGWQVSFGHYTVEALRGRIAGRVARVMLMGPGAGSKLL